MSDIQNKPNEVQFKAADITKQEKLDHFKGRVKEKKNFKESFKKSTTRIKKFAFEGKRKFITISTATVILALVAVLILWLTVWSQTEPDTAADNRPWSEQLRDTTNEAYDILYSDSGSAFSDAIDFFDTKISETTDPDKSFDLRMARAVFLNNNGGAWLAITDLLTIDIGTLTNTQRHHLYLALAFGYRQIGDESSAQQYDAKINEMPDTINDVMGEE
jgi:hypothetical protein